MIQPRAKIAENQITKNRYAVGTTKSQETRKIKEILEGGNIKGNKCEQPERQQNYKIRGRQASDNVSRCFKNRSYTNTSTTESPNTKTVTVFCFFFKNFFLLAFFCFSLIDLRLEINKVRVTIGKKMKRRVCGQLKAPSRQAQVMKFGFLHFIPASMNLTVVFHRTLVSTPGVTGRSNKYVLKTMPTVVLFKTNLKTLIVQKNSVIQRGMSQLSAVKEMPHIIQGHAS